MAWFRTDPRMRATTDALKAVDDAFGSPADAVKDEEFDAAVDADELTASVAGGLRRTSISTGAVVDGRRLAERLLTRDGLTPRQTTAVERLLSVLRQW